MRDLIKPGYIYEHLIINPATFHDMSLLVFSVHKHINNRRWWSVEHDCKRFIFKLLSSGIDHNNAGEASLWA